MKTELPDLPDFHLEEVMTRDEAEEMVGQTVPDLEATITEYGIYRDAETKEPLLIYAPFIGDLARYRKAILNVPMSATPRGHLGFTNVSRTFGMAPRKPQHRMETCRITTLATEEPAVHMTLVDVTNTLSQMVEKYVPEQFEHDKVVMEQVEEDWRISEKSLWTSGVVNKASALPYHRDRSNFETWSAMPVIRKQMRGGMLNIPAWNATVACRDGSVTIFNGFRYVHGVTPMKPVTKDAYRYSVVYYALRGMKDCHTTALEQARGREKRMQREEDFINKQFESKDGINLLKVSKSSDVDA